MTTSCAYYFLEILVKEMAVGGLTGSLQGVVSNALEYILLFTPILRRMAQTATSDFDNSARGGMADSWTGVAKEKERDGGFVYGET